MSPFTLLFGMALLSFAITKVALLKRVAFLSFVAAIALVVFGYTTPLYGFSASSGIAFFEIIVFIVLGAIVLSEEETITITQTLFIATASILLLESTTLLSFILSFEVLSILSFVLVSNITNAREAEGAMKMFIAGSLATALLFLGVSIYLLGLGSIDAAITHKLNHFSIAGVWLMLGALFYKLTIVPMHTWAADSYSQVRPLHAALLSGVVKTVVIVSVFTFFSPFVMQTMAFSIPVFILLAVVTMSLGNLLALFQTRVTKMLAYSSIAHAGYMLLGFVAVTTPYASDALLYMAVAYIFMQSAVFVLIDKLSNGLGTMSLEDLRGLAKRDKWSALLLSVQLFSLAGIPLLAGFLAKALMVYAVVDAGFIWLALFTLLNSALSVGYYGWMIKHIYFDAQTTTYTIKNLPKTAYITQIILLLGTLYFGIFATTLLSVTL